jgi:hypothetical protein
VVAVSPPESCHLGGSSATFSSAAEKRVGLQEVRAKHAWPRFKHRPQDQPLCRFRAKSFDERKRERGSLDHTASGGNSIRNRDLSSWTPMAWNLSDLLQSLAGVPEPMVLSAFEAALNATGVPKQAVLWVSQEALHATGVMAEQAKEAVLWVSQEALHATGVMAEQAKEYGESAIVAMSKFFIGFHLSEQALPMGVGIAMIAFFLWRRYGTPETDKEVDYTEFPVCPFGEFLRYVPFDFH